jgi:hypothetical protein
MGLRRALVMVAVVGCDNPSPMLGPDATTAEAGDDASCLFCFDGDLPDGQQPPPTPPDAIAPPPVACVLDAGDGGAECPLPRSICADPKWLEYFDDGVCVDGGCTFQEAFQYCGPDGCFDGGCILTVTTPPPTK